MESNSSVLSPRKRKLHGVLVGMISAIPVTLALMVAETNMERIVALSAASLVLTILVAVNLLLAQKNT